MLPSLLTHSGPWSTPWTFLTDWRLTTTPPPYPGVGIPKGWRDVYFYPPNDGQPVWHCRSRGATVQVILDPSQRYQRGSQSGLLSVNNIPVLYDPAHSIFHDKYMVIDSHLVLIGSFNFTTEAQFHNAENLVFVDSPQLAALYAANWLFHQAHSAP